MSEDNALLSGGNEQKSDPRGVIRGSKLRTGFLGIDSLYIVLEYPASDVYEFYASIVTNPNDKRLHEGIPFDDFLIRRGDNGYRYSVWHGDARLFITDRVNDALADTVHEGQGMGLMLQLGPKWLNRYGNIVLCEQLIANVLAQFVLFGVQNPELYLARLNRIDVTHDVVGLRVAEFSLDEWRDNWVGRAQQKIFHDSAITGQLETISIGSYHGAIRFKVYDKVAESSKRNSSRFWRSAWGVGEDEPVDVARFEWSIKPYNAHFADLRYLNDLSFERFLDLLNYASLKWGRLCSPQEDVNRLRWPLAPIWQDMRDLVDDWSFDYNGMAKREYDYRPDLNIKYLKSVAGWIAGLMARIGIERELDEPVSYAKSLMMLKASDLSVTRLAAEKLAVYARLVGKGDEQHE